MVMQCKLYKSLTGYNPPEQYLTITSPADALTLDTSGVYTKWIDCKHSISNNMGTVIFDEPTFYNLVLNVDVAVSFGVRSATVIRLMDTDTKEAYIGVIDTIRQSSKGTFTLNYTVDWYTSQMLAFYRFGNSYIVRPRAETILYKRKSDGEYVYSDEGMVPRNLHLTKHTLQYRIDTNDPDSGTLRDFCKSGNATVDDNYLFVYHESTDNATIWLYIRNDNDSTISYSPVSIWAALCNHFNVPSGDSSRTFNPKGLLFFGYYPYNNYMVPAYNLPNGLWTDSNGNTFFEVNQFGYTSNTGWYSIDRFSALRTGYLFTDAGYSKEYSLNRIIGATGNIIYDVPIGFDLNGSKFTIECNLCETSPFLTFILEGSLSGIATQFSFSIPFVSHSYFTDTEAVYYAEDRVYNKEMRNLENTNELVNGIVGGINQGAMISAFSRTQTKLESDNNGINKGVIGGGIGIAGAITNYAYKSLYADKQAERIADKRAKVKADTLSLAGGSSRAMALRSGMYSVEYDSATVTAIQSYQSRFGYQTNAIGSNVALNTFSGYIQAEVILAEGLRTEIEEYIVEMFRNGVKFNAI